MKKHYLILTALCCSLIFAGCSNDDTPAEQQQQQEQPENNGNEDVEAKKREIPKTREDIPLTRSEQEINEKNKCYAFRLLQAVNETLPEEQTEQLVISPLSATYALSMAANGAQGETLDEMIEVLGFGDFTIEEVNGYNQKLVKHLAELDNTAPVYTANSMWIQNNYPIFNSYKETLVENYDAEVSNVDFTDKKTLDILNDWCSEKTKGCIPEYFEQLPADTKLLLLNALYFKGSWREQFLEVNTKKADFTDENGEKTSVDMMHKSLCLDYAKNDAFAMVEVPFGNEGFCMAIVLPTEGTTLDRCIADLDDETWTACQEEKKHTYIDLKLPKFKVEQKFPLNKALITLGMRKAFDRTADFGKISNTGLSISGVNQGTYINVDEYGTEAAAITEIFFVDLDAGGETTKPTPIDFHVTRPFLFFIKEKSTGTILFMGKMEKI